MAFLLRKTLRRTHVCVSQVRWCRLERNTHTSEEQRRGQYRQTDSPTPSPRLLHCLSPSKLTQKEITQVILNSLHAYILPGSPNRTKWEAIDPSSQQKRPTNQRVPQLPSSINSGYNSFTSKIFLSNFLFFSLTLRCNRTGNNHRSKEVIWLKINMLVWVWTHLWVSVWCPREHQRTNLGVILQTLFTFILDKKQKSLNPRTLPSRQSPSELPETSISDSHCVIAGTAYRYCGTRHFTSVSEIWTQVRRPAKLVFY